jgi:hypothetical protein
LANCDPVIAKYGLDGIFLIKKAGTLANSVQIAAADGKHRPKMSKNLSAPLFILMPPFSFSPPKTEFPI